MSEDSDVDAVYIATPHSRHIVDTIMYLEAGKHVLCEKPIGVKAAQVARMAEADFGFRRELEPAHRLFDPHLAGRALLDLGIYPLHLCSTVFGRPTSLAAQAIIGATGVDEQVAAVLRYDQAGLGVVKAAVRTPLTCTARIAGTLGSIDIPAFMHCPDHLIVNTPRGQERIEAPIGLRYPGE